MAIDYMANQNTSARSIEENQYPIEQQLQTQVLQLQEQLAHVQERAAELVRANQVLQQQLARMAEENQQTAIVEERHRLAREIHDTLAQSFSSILVRLQTANLNLVGDPLEAQHHLEIVGELARSGLLEARQLIYQLRPHSLETGDFISAVTQHLHRMTDNTSVRSFFRQQGDMEFIPRYVEVELFRIAQEAINNACKHAHATSLRVELIFSSHRLQLSVQDDGCGFCLSNFADLRGFGLLSMQERTHQIGGQLTINTRLGEGTQILIDVEIRSPNPDKPYLF